MRYLVGAVLLAAALWSGYWFWGAKGAEAGIETWLEQREAEGWVATATDVSTIGYPNRFDTTITDLELSDPETGFSWQAPYFQILALSYKPTQFITNWPDTQIFATPQQTMTISSDNMRGSLFFDAGIDLTLDRATIEFSSVALVSTKDWQIAMRDGIVALRRTPAAANSYDFHLTANDLVMPGRLQQSLSKRGLISDKVEKLEVSATMVFDGPWDRHAIEDARPQPTNIALKTASATWGELELRVAGELEIEADGSPTGEITFKAKNWKEILELTVQAGLIPKQLQSLLESGLQTIARFSGSPNTIDVPLTFSNGRMTLAGLIPLGPAPVFIVR